MSLYVKKSGAWQPLPERSAVYAKVAGAWVPLGLPVPSVPTGLVATPGPGSATLTWNASTIDAPFTIAGYEVNIGGTERAVGNVLTYEWTGLPAVATTAYVRSVASDGTKSAWSPGVPVTPTQPFNAATGGEVTEVPNYRGTGETWRVHRFISNATLTVTAASQPFRVFLIGGGNPGAAASPDCCTPQYRAGGAGGAGGKYLADDNATLPLGANAVTIGGNGGGNTTLGSLVTNNANPNGAGGGNNSGVGGNGVEMLITGTSTWVAGGGGGGAHATGCCGGVGGGAGGAGGGGGGAGSYTDCCAPGGASPGAPGTNTLGGGGGGGSVSDSQYACCGAGGAGGSGAAYIAYRIA